MRRLHLLTVALFVAALLTSCSGASSSAPASSVLPARKLAAGAVQVTITPTRLDTTGATFAISLETHSVDLSLDMVTAAVLDVEGTAWTVEGWTGAGPGGHHRSGELRFTANGPAKGTARLTISGLPEPVVASWDVSG